MSPEVKRAPSPEISTEVKVAVRQQVRRVLYPKPTNARHLDFCVLTRASSRMDHIELQKLVHTDTSDVELDKLEYVWNWPYDTLSLTSRWNLQSLTLSMCDAFAADRWFWVLPDLDLLGQMYKKYVLPNGTVRRYNPIELYPGLDNRLFKYHFVPTPAMRGCWAVMRYSGDDFSVVDPSQVQQHWYPFKAVVSEPIPLHIPPHFVICDTGAKLERLLHGKHDRASYARLLHDVSPLVDPNAALECLARMHAIYRAWMSVTVPDTWKGELPAPRRSLFSETRGEPEESARRAPSSTSMSTPGLSRASSSASYRYGGSGGSQTTLASAGSALRPFTAEEDKRFFDGVKRWIRVVEREGMPPDDAGPPTSTEAVATGGRIWVEWAVPEDVKRKRKRELSDLPLRNPTPGLTP